MNGEITVIQQFLMRNIPNLNEWAAEELASGVISALTGADLYIRHESEL